MSLKRQLAATKKRLRKTEDALLYALERAYESRTPHGERCDSWDKLPCNCAMGEVDKIADQIIIDRRSR